MLIRAVVGVFAVVWAHSALAEFEYHGYMRSGIGWSRGGTDQVCFKAPGTEGASGKHRLGNECETYVEASLSKYSLLGKDRNDPHFSTNFRIAALSNAHRDWEATTTDADFDNKTSSEEFTLALREAYVQGFHLLGQAKPWIGKRFYRRIDIHILDFYLIDNSGPGAGVEAIPTGFGQFHVALIRNIPNSDDGPAQTNVDVRWETPWSAEVIYIYGTAGKRGHASGEDKFEPLDGSQIAVLYTKEIFGGFNRTSLQYGVGIFGASGDSLQSMLNQHGGFRSQEITKGDDEKLDARKKSNTLRFANQLVMKSGGYYSNSVVLMYQNANFGGAENKFGDEIPNKVETTFGVRPAYHFDRTYSIAVEYGYTSVDNSIAPTSAEEDFKGSTLQKITLAPQMTAGDNYWARPSLRLFATHATWNEDAKGNVGDQVYARDTSGFSIGAQLEAWW